MPSKSRSLSVGRPRSSPKVKCSEGLFVRFISNGRGRIYIFREGRRYEALSSSRGPRRLVMAISDSVIPTTHFPEYTFRRRYRVQILKEDIWLISMPTTFRETASPCKKGHKRPWVGQSGAWLEYVARSDDILTIRVSYAFPTEM